MHLNSVECLCIAICFLGVKCQRGWSSNGGYQSGFSNSWGSGFPGGNFGNQQNGFENNFGNSFGAAKPSRENTDSTGFIESNYANTNRRPNEGVFSSGSGKNSNGNYKTTSNSKTESNYDTWQSDVFKGRPKEEKSSAIQSSSDWNTNYNDGFSLSESGKQISNSNSNQNLRPENWNSNVFKNNKLYNDNNKQKVSTDADYEANTVISSWNSNNKKTPRPTSGFGSDKWETTTKKNKKNSEASKWESNNSNRPKQPSASTWNSNKQSNTDKSPTRPTDENNEPKPSSQNISILDELDKNDWYFGKESNYPKPPFKSTLNIDVSELWNFDRNKNKASNQGSRGNGNNRRRNRQIERYGVFGDGIRCECVSVDSCDEEDMILTQEDANYDLRLLEAATCEDLTQVCCTNPKPKMSSKGNFEEKKILRCGERRIGENFAGKLGANIAGPGEFPWLLKLENSEANCSATLIHHKLALTAAHCVAGTLPNEIALTAGIWNTNEERPQTRRVVRIIPHPDFNIQNPRNDIALLVTETPFELTENINTVCLPITNDKWDPSQCVVAGWRSEEIDGQVIKILEKGVVNFLPQAECQNILLVTDLWRNYVLHDSFVCGLEKTGSQSCKEDEGSFLICPSKKEPDVYLQIGVVSKGMNCDNFGRPGLFTNVLKFLDWINRNFFELELVDDIDIRSLH